MAAEMCDVVVVVPLWIIDFKGGGFLTLEGKDNTGKYSQSKAKKTEPFQLK